MIGIIFSDYPNIKAVMKDIKKKEDHKEAARTPMIEKDKPADNYWDSIAEDVASGYETNKDPDEIHNIDEQPGDHNRGDVSIPKENS